MTNLTARVPLTTVTAGSLVKLKGTNYKVVSNGKPAKPKNKKLPNRVVLQRKKDGRCMSVSYTDRRTCELVA